VVSQSASAKKLRARTKKSSALRSKIVKSKSKPRSRSSSSKSKSTSRQILGSSTKSKSKDSPLVERTSTKFLLTKSQLSAQKKELAKKRSQSVSLSKLLKKSQIDLSKGRRTTGKSRRKVSVSTLRRQTKSGFDLPTKLSKDRKRVFKKGNVIIRERTPEESRALELRIAKAEGRLITSQLRPVSQKTRIRKVLLKSQKLTTLDKKLNKIRRNAIDNKPGDLTNQEFTLIYSDPVATKKRRASLEKQLKADRARLSKATRGQTQKEIIDAFKRRATRLQKERTNIKNVVRQQKLRGAKPNVQAQILERLLDTELKESKKIFDKQKEELKKIGRGGGQVVPLSAALGKKTGKIKRRLPTKGGFRIVKLKKTPIK